MSKKLTSDWGSYRWVYNREVNANILLISVLDQDIWLVKPQNFLFEPFINSYSTQLFTYESFWNFIILSANCEYSSLYGSFIIGKCGFEHFLDQIKEKNLSVCFSTKVYNKPIDYYCRNHTNNYFLLLEIKRSKSLIVFPFLDDEHVVDLNHLYTKTKCTIKGKEKNLIYLLNNISN